VAAQHREAQPSSRPFFISFITASGFSSLPFLVRVRVGVRVRVRVIGLVK